MCNSKNIVFVCLSAVAGKRDKADGQNSDQIIPNLFFPFKMEYIRIKKYRAFFFIKQTQEEVEKIRIYH